jgi:hypothetical protein
MPRIGCERAIQSDAVKSDCASCDCTFLFRTAAEIRVMTSPIGRDSRNVIAALINGVLVPLLVFLYLLKLRLDGCRTRARGLKLLDHIDAVFVHEIVHEVEVENFPRQDIADTKSR